MRKILVKALTLVFVAGFVACNDDDPAPQGTGDAYVISKSVQAEEEGGEPDVVYGLRIDAYGYYGTVSSVTVTGGGINYTLEQNPDYDYAFSYETDEDAYSTMPPTSGTYTYTFNFETGEIYTLSEALSSDVLLPANIVTADYAGEEINLEWEEVDDAEYIYVRMKEADGDVIFSSIVNYTYLAGDDTDYTISQSSGDWESGYTLNEGETYTVEVIALLTDTSGGIQAASIGTTTVVWGVEEE